MHDLISIVIPIYNVEDYLERCLDSVLAQKYYDIEIILVDDGSTDHSSDIAKRYAQNNKKVKYYRKINGGLSDARNYGIVRSKGKYITFIDSDDEVDKDYITILYNNIIKYQCQISIASFKYIGETQNKGNKSHNHKIKVYTSNQILKKMYEPSHNIDLVTAWGKLYDAEIFNNIRFPVGKIHEDEFTTYKTYMHSERIVFQDTGLYFYRVRSGSIVDTKYKKMDTSILDAYSERIKEVASTNKSILALTCYMYVYNALKMKSKYQENNVEYADDVFNSIISDYYTPIKYVFMGIHPYRVIKLICIYKHTKNNH